VKKLFPVIYRKECRWFLDREVQRRGDGETALLRA
jgi:hypothetical protein